MRPRRRWLLPALLASSSAWAAGDCAALHERALRESVGLQPPLPVSVGGRGRAHFHDGPDAACRRRDLFLVPGDQLQLLLRWNDWMQVRYIARNGQRHVTWLPAARVAMVAPSR